MGINITDVEVVLNNSNDKLFLASASVVFDDDFIVKEIKVIKGKVKGLFVCMPSRRMTDHCGQCGHKNHLRANFCNNCGLNLAKNNPVILRPDVKNKLYTDLAHPINTSFREILESAVIDAYAREKELSTHQGYIFYRNHHNCETD